MLRTLAVCGVLLAAAPAMAQAPQVDPAHALIVVGRGAAAANDYPAAEADFREALQLQTRQFGPTAPVLGETLLELALQVSNQTRFEEAAALFRRAAPIVDAQSDGALRARAALYRAMDAANRRDYATAMRFARDAVLARQADVDKARAAGVDAAGNPPVVPAAMLGELALSLKLEAEMAVRLGDVPTAQAAGERALYIMTEQQDLPLAWRPQMISLMGDINSRLSQTAIAEKQYLQALAIDKKLFGENATATINAELKLGAFYDGEQVYASAITFYRQAFAGLAQNAQARRTIAPDQIIPFLDAVTASRPDADLNAAMFAASQLVDSGVESQTIARVAARRAADNPALAQQVRAAEDAARAEAALRGQLAIEHARSDDERDAAREKALADALPAATQKSTSLLAKLRADFPDYARLTAPSAATVGALQQALHPGEAYISYLLGINRGYVLAITRNGLTVRPTGAGATEISNAVAAIRTTLTPRLGKLPDFNTAAAFALYRSLLAPVGPQLAGVDHLLVSTSGDLSSLPFGLLLTEDMRANRDYGRAPWLVRQFAISNVPAPAAFLTLRATPVTAASRPLLMIGNPAFEGSQGRAMEALATNCQGGGVMDAALLRAMPPLPETVVEMQAVAGDLKALPGDTLSGAGATESAVRSRPLDQYQVLYFATHGLLPGELRCQAEPGLVLTPPAATAATAQSDGLLTASEVANLRLNASLVVLSACNTAATGGTGFGGSALEGLADAFFNAGARAVLATHWEIPSAATAALMIAMFDARAGNGHDTAAALRQAQLNAINNSATAHPYDWAGFTLLGDAS